MRDLVKSGLSFTWAMPLFGTQQLAAWLSSDGDRRRRAAGGFDAVTLTAADRLGQEGLLGRLYQLGQCAQEGLINMGPTLLTPDLLYPSTWAELSVDVAQRSLAATGQLAAGNAGLAVDELRSKGEVFCLVLGVARLLRIPTEERTGGVPAGALTMLNAGIGLSFAQYRLGNTGSRTSPGELAGIVADVVRLCRDNARPGYLGAAWESLGLVTRTFHPDLVRSVDRALRAVAPEVLGYYWHGVGRAIFFAPINFLPGSDGYIFDMAAREAPDEPARLSALAGAAWAYGLVAQRDPEILASLVVAPYGEALERNGGFANGIASAMMTRYDTTRSEEHTSELQSRQYLV